MIEADLPHLVIGACMSVHRHLGPGLAREAYEECLAIELRDLELSVERGKPLDFRYRNHEVRGAARLDLVVDDRLLVQVKSCREVTEIDTQQMDTLLRLSGLRSGLLVNFNVAVMRKGIHRVKVKRLAGDDAA